MEKIGRVKLDYSRYLGEDLYCDGAVEDEILDIVKTRSAAEYADIIVKRKNWPILYHLSPLRENIIDWIPMEVSQEISGSRAGTGSLAFSQGEAGPSGGSLSQGEEGPSGEGLSQEEALSSGESLSPEEAFPSGEGLSPEEMASQGAVSLRENVLSQLKAFYQKEEISQGADSCQKETAFSGKISSRGEMTSLGSDSMGGGSRGSRPKVLEVGSGCGAITGALARKAGSVTCVDLSKKRSMINAYRHRECENITIHVGNFKDIEPHLPRDYDFIFLIGVFEYGQSYIGGDTPYEDFLKMLLSHLAYGGRIVIAIENKYGLKYFAGCQEDHLGTYYSGLENYVDGGCVRTFSRQGLERIFRSCGVEEYHFYYPYPDYKFMSALYSDEYLPGKGELYNNLRNLDMERMIVFDENSAFDGISEDGLFSVFSNSYLAVIGEGFATKFVKYSNERAGEYAVRTQIMDSHGMAWVRKYPLSAASRDHVRSMGAAYESLRDRYRGSNLEINRCRVVEEEGIPCAEFEFVQGMPLSALMDRCMEKGDQEGFYRLVRQYVRRIGYNGGYPASDFDPIFSNIIVDGDRWTLIDYEWTFGKPIETRELVFRAVHCYMQGGGFRNRCSLEGLWKELGITEADAAHFLEQEEDFQRFVTGKVVSLAQMREFIGFRTFNPRKMVRELLEVELLRQIQVYEDRGGGFSEICSYQVKEVFREGNVMETELAVEEGVKVLRVDPALQSCIVKLLEVTFNGREVPLHRKKFLQVNGTLCRPGQKGEKYCPSIIYPTEDPNIVFNLGMLERQPENRFHLRMEVLLLPLSMAQDIAARGQGLFQS